MSRHIDIVAHRVSLTAAGLIILWGSALTASVAALILDAALHRDWLRVTWSTVLAAAIAHKLRNDIRRYTQIHRDLHALETETT